CHEVCKPVCETCYRTVCEQHCHPVCETCMKTVCCTMYRECVETCYKDCVKTICKPVTTCKTVTKKCGHWETCQYTVPGRTPRAPVVARSGCRCCDPCTCRSHWPPGHFQRCCETTCPETKCRRVWKEECVCESVPCTTYVKECVHEKVPYTVCKKVPYTVQKQVPVTTTRMVRETVTKQVPYTVTRMERSVVRTQVPYTTTRVARGAYCDEGYAPSAPGAPGAPGVGAAGPGCGGCAHCYGCDGPGRRFVEGCSYEYTTTSTTTRMVPETHTRKVSYTVWENVTEQHC